MRVFCIEQQLAPSIEYPEKTEFTDADKEDIQPVIMSVAIGSECIGHQNIRLLEHTYKHRVISDATCIRTNTNGILDRLVMEKLGPTALRI